jgi:multiple sugar transport system permease protein
MPINSRSAAKPRMRSAGTSTDILELMRQEALPVVSGSSLKSDGNAVAGLVLSSAAALVAGLLEALGFTRGALGAGMTVGFAALTAASLLVVSRFSLPRAPWVTDWRNLGAGGIVVGATLAGIVGGWAGIVPGLVGLSSVAFLLLHSSNLPRRVEANLWGWVLVLPAMLLLVVWHFAPAAFALLQSFFDNLNFVSPARFAGLENYAILLRDSLFWKSLLNTFWYVILTVPIGILIATLLAILLNENVRGLTVFRTIYFLPYITALTAAAAVWKWIYNPDFGLLNAILGTVGAPWLENPNGILALVAKPLGLELSGVLRGPSVALVCVMVMSIWHQLGYAIVILLAGLQNVPREYYEAASLDGASWWDTVRHITWPLLSPTTFFLAVTGLIGSFQVFTQILVLTPGGGVLNDTLTIVKYLYDKGFRDGQFSYASAMAFALFAIVFGLTLVQNRMLSRRVNYEL